MKTHGISFFLRGGWRGWEGVMGVTREGWVAGSEFWDLRWIGELQGFRLDAQVGVCRSPVRVGSSGWVRGCEVRGFGGGWLCTWCVGAYIFTINFILNFQVYCVAYNETYKTAFFLKEGNLSMFYLKTFCSVDYYALEF